MIENTHTPAAIRYMPNNLPDTIQTHTVYIQSTQYTYCTLYKDHPLSLCTKLLLFFWAPNFPRPQLIEHIEQSLPEPDMSEFTFP